MVFDYLIENSERIITIIGAITALTIAITSLVKVFRTERRTVARLDQRDREVIDRLNLADQNVKITREGVVQAIKDGLVTTDVKVSINRQVEKILDEKLDSFLDKLFKNEENKTKLTYWAVRILEHTAAADKLTNEQKTELYETLSLIVDEELIIDTLD